MDTENEMNDKKKIIIKKEIDDICMDNKNEMENMNKIATKNEMEDMNKRHIKKEMDDICIRTK